MPGTKHHTDKWRKCVDEVMGKGHDESSASAICTTSLQNSGEAIFVGAEACSEDEMRLLGDSPGHEFHGNQYSGEGGGNQEANQAKLNRLFEQAKMREKARLMNEHHKEIQGLRNRGQHVEASKIEKRGPKFPPNILEGADETELLRELHLLGATGPVRYEQLNGRKHLVVPIIALMEGVIHPVNAATPEFVSEATLRKAASSWVGKPVTLGHPSKSGKQCSASEPSVRSAVGIGVIMKSEMQGKKLCQEAWIDDEKARKLHTVMYENLAAGGREEVSVGAFVIADSKQSTFNGKPYKAEWLETQGDHLAFLPGGRGACSVEMGCGTHRAAMHFVAAESIELVPDATSGTLAFTSLEGASFDDRISAVNKAVNDKWPGGSVMPNAPDYGYVIQTFDDHVIVRKGDDYWDMPYTVKDGVVTLGEGKKVKQQWVSAAAKKMCETCDGTGQVKDGTKQQDCPSCDGEGYMKAAAAAIQPPPVDDSKIHIRRTGSKWELVGSSGRVLARHDTELEAKAQAEAVKAKVCA